MRLRFAGVVVAGVMLGGLVMGSLAQQPVRQPAQQPARERGPIQVVSVGPPRLMFNTAKNGCNKYDIPDAPARAFRGPSGTVHLFFSSTANHPFLGPDLNHLTHTCDVAFKSALNNDPKVYDDNGWLTAFWTEGQTVYALVHNEFHAWAENKKLCPTYPNSNCSEVSVSEVVSQDGGQHFQRQPGLRSVEANMPYPFHEEPHWYGYMNPSNIVKHGDDYYFLVSMIHPTDRDKNGVCVMHTKTVGDPASWRGWDGTGFTIKTSVDAYHGKLADPEARRCVPLPRGSVGFSLGTLGWSQIRQSYLLLTRVQKWDKVENGRVAGCYLAESKDMIHWSEPVLVLSDADAGGENQYASLIDPSAPDPNFMTIGNNPLLYTMTNSHTGSYGGLNIMVRQVHLKQ